VCRWLQGIGPLPSLDAYRQVELYVGGAVKADELAAWAAPTPLRRPRGNHPHESRAVDDRLPPSPFTVVRGGKSESKREPPPPIELLPPEPSELSPELAEYAHDAAMRSGCSKDELLFERLTEIACFGRTEAARMKAIGMLLDRCYGTTIQKSQDMTIREPAGHSELLAVYDAWTKRRASETTIDAVPAAPALTEKDSTS
jgi:hypothetical protein